MGFAAAAVRGRGGPASKPRQALIGATVVCPDLPRIPWRHFFHPSIASRIKPRISLRPVFAFAELITASGAPPTCSATV